MRLNITVENVETGEEETVLAGLAVLRAWEAEHGKPAIGEITSGYAGPILELAVIAHNRKHGRTVSVDEWADLYEVLSVDSGSAAANPTEPATAPPSD
jgi:hypothetical protein